MLIYLNIMYTLKFFINFVVLYLSTSQQHYRLLTQSDFTP